MDTVIIIPARMASTRAPGKPLWKKDGRTLIEHVYRKCTMTGWDVAVATDHKDIANEVDSFGGKTIMTSVNNATGTDRVAEATKFQDYKYVINVQGDMPYIHPKQIIDCQSIVKLYDVGTLIYDMDPAELTNPNSVKCIAVKQKPEIIADTYECKWFGRMAVEYGYHHAGIYAYQRNALRDYAKLSVGKYEDIEKLEQLRWLENGFRVFAKKTTPIAGEINTPKDYDNWIATN